jgi:hypothetical protein
MLDPSQVIEEAQADGIRSYSAYVARLKGSLPGMSTERAHEILEKAGIRNTRFDKDGLRDPRLEELYPQRSRVGFVR